MACIDATIERFGGLDILVNNAGANPYYGFTLDVDEARYDKTFEVNLRGPLFWSQVAWRKAFKEQPGVIINIASVGGLRTEFGLGVYNVTKAALIHLTRQLAGEIGPTRVVGIAPGLVKTDFADYLVENFGDDLAARMPTKRLGEPEDIANLVDVPGQRQGELDHRRHLRHRRRRRRRPAALVTALSIRLRRSSLTIGKEDSMIESAFPIITTPDLERALGFYRDLLGGTVSFAFPPEGPPGVRRRRPRVVAPRDRPRPGGRPGGRAAHRAVGLHRRLRRRRRGGARGRRDGGRGARRPAVGRARRPRRSTPTATASSSAPAD